MFENAKYKIYWVVIILVLLSSCNIFDVETKNLNPAKFDDFWLDDKWLGQKDPYLKKLERYPSHAHVRDSIKIVFILHDSLSYDDFIFNWSSKKIYNQMESLPEGIAEKNIYKTIAPDTAGTYTIGLYLHSDSTYSDTLSFYKISVPVSEPE